jgi:hypothetical protein
MKFYKNLKILIEKQENLDKEAEELVKNENLLKTLITITIPYLIAGFGMVGAGILLDIVQVQNITEIVLFEIKYLIDLGLGIIQKYP